MMSHSASPARHGDAVAPQRYHPILVVLHWFLAAFIVLDLILGTFVLKAIPNTSPQKLEALRAHMTGGLVILGLMGVRLLIRLYSAKPASANTGHPRLERLAALSHGTLYLLVFAMAASGLATALITDLPRIVFGGAAIALPDSFAAFPTRIAHGVIAKALIGLIGLHVAAALYHPFVRRDGLLRRMWFGRRSAAPRAEARTQVRTS